MGDMDYIGGLRTYLRQVQAGKVDPIDGLLKPAPDGYPWKSYAHYLDEIQALRTGADQWVAPIGQVLLALRGREAVRWLLTVESLLSLGDSDPWRIARGVAELLHRCPARIEVRQVWESGEKPPGSWQTLYRLNALGVLRIHEREYEDDEYGYEVNPEALSLLEEIAQARETPYRVLARSLLQDEFHRTARSHSPELARALTESITEGFLNQARLTGHELRNTLNPVKLTMEDLFQSLSEAGVHLPELDKYRQRMTQRLDRAFDFVDELLRTARLRAEGGEPFDISDCLEEARSGLNGAADCVAIDCPSGLPPRTGVRRRFVLAMINLLRNATQAAAAAQAPQVRVSVHRQDQRIQILIDDNGPGVDQADRQHIFLEGVSMRPGGGGVGLGLCREALRELGGDVFCDDKPSPLGGARFVVTLGM